MVLKILGGIVFVTGLFLWCGNVFGFFHTVPLAGYITAAIGAFIFNKGRGEPAAGGCCGHDHGAGGHEHAPSEQDKPAA